MSKTDPILFKANHIFSVRIVFGFVIVIGGFCLLGGSNIYTALAIAFIHLVGYLFVMFFSNIPRKIWLLVDTNQITIEFVKYYFQQNTETYSIQDLTWGFERKHIGRGIRQNTFVIQLNNQSVLELPTYTGWTHKQLLEISQQLHTIKQSSTIP